MALRHFGSLLILFFILLMIFGTKRLREVGDDLAVAIKSFRRGLQENDEPKAKSAEVSTETAQDKGNNDQPK